MNTKYKRPLDIFIILIAHCFPPFTVLWLVIWTIIPISIWLQDRGPIFYSQRRIGKDGKVFVIRKFRTMIPNAEAATGIVWSSKDDPRITRIGKVLRWTALDELPQLWNIINGDMTLVGPRSERPELHDEYLNRIPNFDLRLKVRPGLTGLAQIRGAYNITPEEKLHHDLEYINQMNILLDIQIIMLSIWSTVNAKWDRPN